MSLLYQEAIFSENKQAWRPYLYLVPAIVVYTAFMLYPLYRAFFMSFHRFTSFTGSNEWVGLANYQAVLSDPLFWRSFQHTLIFSLGIVFIPALIGLGLAVILNTGLRGSILFRTAIFTPQFVPVVVAGLIFTLLFSESGVINSILSTIGLIEDPITWLSSQYALGTIVTMSIWKRTGYFMIILFAGLQGIPESYYEAAKIQGKSKWQQFRYITLPLLKPALIVVFIIGIIDTFKLFAHVWVMTEGGPAHASETLSTYFYKTSFIQFQFGRGAAIGFILFAISLVLSAVIIKRSGYT